MTSDIEELVRKAQARQAERAVDPDRIRAALPARPARRVRYQRYGGAAALATAGAVAAVVLAPPLLRPVGDSGVAQQPATTAPTSTTTVSTPASGTLHETINRLRRTVQDGRTSGEISTDAARDVLLALDRLDQAAASGRSADLRGMVDDLRHRVDIHVREQAIRPGVPSSLYADLDRLRAAV